jgi:tRNA (adenine-N(1)-)-methyltransferase non-catalytic subunit
MQSTDDTIKNNSWILIKTPANGVTKLAQVKTGTKLSLGRHGQFEWDDIIDKYTFGCTFEITASTPTEHDAPKIKVTTCTTLKLLPRSAIVDREQAEWDQSLSTANNREIFDVPDRQALSVTDIQALKAKMLAGDADLDTLVMKIAENNEGFDKKTEHSKNKYIRRKHSKYFTP